MTKQVSFVLASFSTLLSAAWGDLPIEFEPNRGQGSSQVQFLARGHGFELSLDRGGASFRTGDGLLRMRLEGAAAGEATGEERLPGISSYLQGSDPSAWITGVPHFRRVRYRGVYRGIDLVYYGNGRQLEYDFVVHPGSDPSRIRFQMEGASGVRIDNEGNLVLDTGLGRVMKSRPVLYQEVGNGRRAVEGRFQLHAGGSIGFSTGHYDRQRPLVIDPTIQFATLFGARLRETATSIAVDRNGDVYVAGMATSDNFPATSGAYQPRVIGGTDIFVVKLNSTGTAILYATLLGGSDEDTGGYIAVDQDGNAYVGGTTRSINYPTTSGVMRDRPNGPAGDTDGFLSKLNNTGTNLLYSTRIGGRGSDTLNGVAIDLGGNAHVTGDTVSTDFLVTEGSYRVERKGTVEIYVSKINPSASQMIWSTFHGGDVDSFVIAVETGRAIAVDRTGNVYVAGITTLRDFPVTSNAVQRVHFGGSDVFLSKFDPAGKVLLYSTLLGGEENDTVNGLAVDSNGTNIYLVGETLSLRFPVTPQVVQTFRSGGDLLARDGFVTKINANGEMVYSTFLGGNGDDVINGVAADLAGNAYVIGTSSSTNIPVTNDALQTTRGGDVAGEPYDSYLAYINPIGTQLTFGTYLGGQRNDNGIAIARDAGGNLYFAGYTQSSNFPVTPGAIMRSTGASTNAAFIARIGDQRPVASQLLMISGNNQSANEGTAIPAPLVAELRDAFNNPVAGATVNFTAANATISANTVTTNAQGRAQVTVTLGNRPGQSTVTATFANLAPVVFRLTSIRVGPPLPEINEEGVVGGGRSTPPYRVLAIKGRGFVLGRNFAPAGADVRVQAENMVDGKAPTVLGGSCVTLGGIAARLLWVSSGEIEFQVPETVRQGSVPVVVISNCGQAGELRSDERFVEVRATAPEFFSFFENPDGRNPVFALNADTGARIGPPEAGQGLQPATPNMIISAFGQGFGNTFPNFGSGEIARGMASTTDAPVIILDGIELSSDHVLYSGVADDQIGIYRLTFRVPAVVRNGNLSLNVRYGVNESPAGPFLRVAGGQNLNPQISTSPSRLELGDVVVNTTRETPFTVANAGTFPLNVRSFSVASPVFSVVPSFGFRLEPGEARVVTLRFTPTIIGPVNINLQIASDDPANPILNVPITASVTGVPPVPNPTPMITGLSPEIIDAGGAAFNLIVNGSGFVRSSAVEVNNRPRPTFFNHAGQLIAFLQAQDIADPGAVVITVFTPEPGGGRSQPVSLTIRPTAPANQPIGIINQLDLRFCPNITAYTSVLDAAGVPFRNLSTANISCAEESQITPCDLKPAGVEAPISLTFLFGMNGIDAQEDQVLLRSAARQFVFSFGIDDRIQLVHLEDVARQQIEFTTEKDRVAQRIDLLVPVPPGNALYDGVVTSAQSTVRETGRRQIVVVVTALDNLSGILTDVNQGLGTARASGVTFYTIALNQGNSNPNLTGYLRQLARETGGQFFGETSSLNYQYLFSRLSTIIQGQYAVTVSSPNPDSRSKPLTFNFRTPAGTVTAIRTYSPCLR